MRVIPIIVIAFILTGAISSCKDDPVTPPGGKDTCDTCIVDTTDTTDTTVVTPNDTTSHDFIWTESSISGEASIGGCWVFSDTSIWAVGGRVYTYDKGSWVYKPLVNQHGYAIDFDGALSGASIFGFTESDLWINHYGGAVWHYDGKVAKEFRPEVSQGVFRAAWGTSSKDMFFVGDKGTIVHFDGMNWKKFPKVTEKNLRKVWGTSSSNVWAGGYNQSTAVSVLLHYNGASWSEVSLSDLGDIRVGNHVLNTVWTIDSAGHSTVIAAGSLVWRRTDNGAWRSDSGKVSNRLNDGGFVALYAIRGNTSNDVMLSGAGGWISHWNGRSWYHYDQLFNWADQSYDTSPMDFKGNTVVLAGKRGGKGFVAIGRRAK